MIRQGNRGFRSYFGACAATGVLAVAGLAGLAGVVGSRSASPAPPARETPVDARRDKASPRRIADLALHKNGWTYDCMECHALFPAKWHYERPMRQHADIRLDHGNNRFCLNCHHPTNRNAFVDYDGSEIPESKVDLLCGKCHGTIHRDWAIGVHGRRNGYWNKEMGEQTRLACNACHDPHSPAFKPMHPLAPLRYPPRAYNSQPSHPSDPHASGEAHN